MPHAATSVGRIYYEVAGPVEGEVIVLIHGLGAQLVAWPATLVDGLTATGHRVVRFDNRDAGLSERVGEHRGPYDLRDMATDVTDLMDHLGTDRAHLVGVSLGGMIAQRVALDRPDRVASLTLYTTTPSIPRYCSVDLATFSPTRAESRAEASERYADMEEANRVSGWTRERLVALGGRLFDRAYYPEGTGYQIDGALREDRVEELRSLRLPTAIIHGTNDPIFPVDAAVAMNRAITGSVLHVYEGMGHEVPARLGGEHAAIIADLVAKARHREPAGLVSGGQPLRSR